MRDCSSSFVLGLSSIGLLIGLAACGDDSGGSGGASSSSSTGPGSGAGSAQGGAGTGGEGASTSSAGEAASVVGRAEAASTTRPSKPARSPRPSAMSRTAATTRPATDRARRPSRRSSAPRKARSPARRSSCTRGTYDGGAYIADLAGTESAPIWIGGAEGESKPVLQGGGNAMQLVRARYVIVHDLEVRNATANGLSVDDGADYANENATRYVVFRDLDIHDIGSSGNQDCLKLSGVNDYWVLSSSFARCGGGMSGSGVDHVGCHRGVIAGNRFRDMAASGNAIQCKGGSTDITIVANHIEDGGARAINLGGSTGFEFFRPPLSTSAPNAEARRIHVIANLIEGSVAPLAFVGCVDCLATNNTILTPGNWVVRILQETVTGGGYEFLAASNGRVANNLVYYDRSAISTHVNVGANTDVASFTFQNNLWYAYDQPGNSAPSLPVAETGGVVGSDPGFVDGPGGDYRLAPTSPAIGAGTTIAELLGDLDGTCYLPPPSIGAYEGGAE
jgi:hypothetical protein